MGRKINRFARDYAMYFGKPDSEGGIDLAIGPVITSGYRGPERQVTAMWYQWVNDRSYIVDNYVNQTLARPVHDIFTANASDRKKAIRLAAKELGKLQKKTGDYLSNHGERNAVDLSLFKGGKYGKYNQKLYDYLADAKRRGIISSFLDERGKKRPHFHVKL